MKILTLTPAQLVAGNAQAFDSGTTITIRLNGQEFCRIDDFVGDALLARLPEDLRRKCPQHGRRPNYDRSCNCAWVFRSQVFAAQQKVKANLRRSAA